MGISEAELLALKVAMRQGIVCATMLIVVLPPWHTLPHA